MKYGNIRTNGMGSKLEASVYQILCLKEKAGMITSIQKQVRVLLATEKITYELTGKIVFRPIYWKVDFSYIDQPNAKKVWVEAKGVETRDYKAKLKIWRESGPGLLEIYKGSWRSPRLVEVVVPKEKW